MPSSPEIEKFLVLKHSKVMMHPSFLHFDDFKFWFHHYLSSVYNIGFFFFPIVCNTRDAPMYFCERIYKCMAYYPPDYSQLIRDAVSRSEVCSKNLIYLYLPINWRTKFNQSIKLKKIRSIHFLLIFKNMIWISVFHDVITFFPFESKDGW